MKEIQQAYVVTVYDDNSGYKILSVHPSLEEANEELIACNKEVDEFKEELGLSVSYNESGQLQTKFLNTPTNAQAAVHKCTIEFLDNSISLL